MTLAPDDGLARGIAWGLLAAEDWTADALQAAVTRTLGRPCEWAGRVVGPVLAAYREPPTDRPDELARFLLLATPLTEIAHAVRQEHEPLRVRVLAPVPGRMGRRRWPVPDLPDLVALARLLEVPLDQLDWLADTARLQRRSPPGPYQAFEHRWRSRPHAAPRLLEAPGPLLRAVQRRILDRILAWVPVHPAAHGFVGGRSAITNAARHVGAPTVVALDLRSFFSTITAARVGGLYRTMGLPEAVVRVLTGLSTHATPGWVLSGMPAGGDPSERHRLRATLRSRHLPQGSPTSPALANLACFSLDHRLQRYAETAGLVYSRYADDLTFSGPVARPAALLATVSTIIVAEGFVVHPGKSRVRRTGERQTVTGIVTNRRPGIARSDRDRLRAVLHDARRHGPEAANRERHPHFREHLHGRITWVESVSPVQGRRLRAQYEAIVWPER
ncbi:reverse transcriptase family protein [Microlunatus kandeliicorticis]|uniref:reverse transcriptase family protein n=1 Tax=Microlunatus kandeliicorticis TaxID=1759536 RepID=UPI0015F7E521|nr:reverse transcriptase family protein [Microlunatus kandeliicorticis]